MIEKLEWDSKFFGKKIGRLTNVLSGAKLKRLLKLAHASNYSYLSYRATLKKMSHIYTLEKNGFYVTDIGVILERNLKSIPKTKIAVREATIDDYQMLKKLTKGLFIYSRFYNDPFFARKDAERLYQKWVENSLLNKSEKIFIVKNCGFILCKKLSHKMGNVSLVGVESGRQGEGIGQKLVCTALQWLKRAGMNIVSVRTQVNNINALNFYMQLGFRIKYVDITMGRIIKE